MANHEYPRGSEWARWDLHIHTPSSICQQYGEENDDIWERFISDLENLPKEFKAIGINDYLFLDGYEKVLDYKNSGRLGNIELILPVIEFRIEKFAGIDFGNLKRINLHVIFSDEIENGIETIRSQFLNSLEQSYTIDTDRSEWNRAITKESIESLGEKIKENVPSQELSKYGSDLDEGFNNLNVDEKKIFDLLKRDIFKDKYLTAIGKTEWDSLKWSDTSISTKKSIINKVDLVFTASESFKTWEAAQTKLTEQNVNNHLLDCSDAHSFSTSTNKDRIGNCFTWIKANPTFEGLKQIKYEYKERVFIGSTPELIERVSANKTKYIKSINITKEDSYNGDRGTWFNEINIPINYGMVAIIGNRGSGKSALADIIGLCGNSYTYSDFSFLNRDRFLKNNLAENFIADIHWENNDRSSKNLLSNVDYNAPERVRYLPQNFFDRLTNNLDNYDFQKTLENIVFSYLPEEEKLGKNTFHELIAYKEETINKDIGLISNQLLEINKKIVLLEDKLYPTYREKLEKELEIKEKEFSEHIKNKSPEVTNPELDKQKKEHNKDISEQISKKNTEKDSLSKRIEENQDKKVTLTQEIQELDNLFEDFKRFKSEIKSFIDTNKEILNKYELSIDSIFKYTIDLSSMEKKIETKKIEYRKIKESLLSNEEIEKNYPKKKHEDLNNKSLIIKHAELRLEIEKLSGQLSEPFKKYQDYLEKLKDWENKKKEIEGGKDIFQSINWYKNELEHISNELPNIITETRNSRIEKSKDILGKILELVEIYYKLKKSVEIEIEDYKNILGDYDINIDVSLKIKPNFIPTFLSYINQSKKGSFFQIDEGRNLIKKIISESDLKSPQGFEAFLNNIIHELEYDSRKGYNDEKRYMSDQINNDKLLDFYNYLFSLGYINPSYELKLGEKHLTELSPGEKGSMLIVFYLMLDKNNIPLIIDQPEENLDNESIYNILVHFIRDSKKRRQVILVTHNPNLAIVGDAEQIIYVTIDKKEHNTFNYESGAIEHLPINKHASDILEGTLKAFDIRRLKYFKI